MRVRLVPALIIWAIFLALFPIDARAGYLAVSLSQVEAALRAGQPEARAVELGGLNRLLGMVVDPSGDLILIGRHDAGVPSLTTDHLAIALRSVYVTNAYPLVSLDGTPDTPKTGLLHVRFEGGVERTQFGSDLLLADLALKRLALGLLPAKLWNVPSYLELSAGSNDANAAHTRFWFTPKDSARLLQRDGVFIIRRLDIAVRTETVGPAASDPPASQFAAALETAFPDVAATREELARVKPLFDIVALAAAIKSVKSADAMKFWLHDYHPAIVNTPQTFSMLRNSQSSVRVEGGLDLRVLFAGIAAGDTTALRQAVLLSRPSVNAMTWPVPLADWPTESGAIPDGGADERTAHASLTRQAGTSVIRSITSHGTSPASIGSMAPTSFTGMIGSEAPRIPTFASAPSQSLAPPHSIGGVWLAGAARPSQGQASINPSGSGFSLLVDGEDGVLPSDRFARFVTALWAVYLSPTPPGISIDPMGVGMPKHLVRYIGHIVNSDLARVMRESDYLMKQLAVGSASVDVPGFKDVDRLSGLRGLTYAGASRRFWFVPENLQFRSSDGVLRFDSGSMTLKTEYVQTDGKVIRAEQADLDFAAFFTKNYSVIAARQPIFQDLLDYAKLVGLATYLKQQRVPLLWFLLANRDQIVTEDSPGTVDAIVRQSKVFEGVKIEGGVDLTPAGRYLPDAETITALRRARASAGQDNREAVDQPQLPPLSQGPVTVGNKHYTVVPQTSAAAGRDSAGRRYQTDIALRGDDGQPGLELVRYYDPAKRQNPGAFGDGWSLLVPYRVEPADRTYRSFRNARIPERMVVINLVTGQREQLSFSDSRYAIAGWVPENAASSKLVGLFPLSDGSFRLADKLGANFAFDGAGQLTDMALSPAYQMHFDQVSTLTAKDFVKPPYQLNPDGIATRQIDGASLPARLSLRGPDGDEPLVLQTDSGLLGYYPLNASSRIRMVAVLSTGDLRLLDQSDGEFAFDRTGHFVAMLLAQPIVTRLSQGEQSIAFRFMMGRNGNPMVAEAASSADPSRAVKYDYDGEARTLLAAAFR